MAQRLIELHRILKDTGSIYFHCDPTMSHYIKLLMDIIFGKKNFRNEIVWNYRTYSQRTTRRHFEMCYDSIFCYVKSIHTQYNPIYIEESIPIANMKKYGFSRDARGYYKTAPRGGYSEKTIRKMDAEGLIYWTKNKIPRKKYYRNHDSKFIYDSKMLGNCWRDIADMMHKRNEKLSYPTQKPLALLERIVKASSNEGDVVLDPFCGCATTCIAAERLKRQWVGIDVSKKAFDLVQERLIEEVIGIDEAGNQDMLKRQNEVILREDIPQRTDITDIDLSYRSNKVETKHTLYDRQEGVCNGCKLKFEYRHFEIDHIVPVSKGGGDNIENLQLLCNHCNRIKSSNAMSYLVRYLKINRIGGYR